MQRRRFLPALGFALVTACGGKVIWVAGNDDGAGGSHAQSSSTGINENPAPSSSATGMISEGCQAFCATPACAAGDPMACLQQCAASYTPGCEGQIDDYFKCIAASFASDCLIVQGPCDSEASALAVCQHPGECLEVLCSGNSSSCNCADACFGQPVATKCVETPDGSITCQCGVNGTWIGTCVDTNLSCDPQTNCCNQFFGSTGGD